MTDKDEIYVDHEYWQALATDHPDIFDEMKKDFLEKAVDTFTDDPVRRQRLKAMLWRQEQELNLHYKAPEARQAEIQRRVWESLGELRNALSGLVESK